MIEHTWAGPKVWGLKGQKDLKQVQETHFLVSA